MKVFIRCVQVVLVIFWLILTWGLDPINRYGIGPGNIGDQISGLIYAIVFLVPAIWINKYASSKSKEK